MKLSDFRIWGLAPAWIIMTLALILPICVVVLVSLGTRGSYGGFEFGFSFASFQKILFSVGWTDEREFNPQYLVIIGRTVLLASVTTVICMVLSFPVAYFIARQDADRKSLLIYLVTLPFWVSMIVRVYSWIIILGNDGVLDTVLTASGLKTTPGGFLFGAGAMLTGLVYSYIPLMILPVFAAIERLDTPMIEASHDLYANRWVTLRRVILPVAWPGLMAGAILVFVPCLGAVLEPVLLGGGKKLMMGNLIADQFGGARDWPFGSAIALVMMATVMAVLMTISLRAARREKSDARPGAA